MRWRLFTGLLAAGACLLAEGADACSENVFRPGQGMAYRKLATAIPARVLIDADPVSQAFGAARAAELQQGLTEAGHTVAVATDAQRRSSLLAAETFDVVLTSIDQAAGLSRVTPSGQPPPLAVAVVARATDAAAKQRFPQAVSADASLRQVLKAIERTLESRRE